ncbi:serine phosphatase RsbU [Leptospira ryugenii]|uniref:Serine phosphatase RsbU n=1 Tax=Leptospira ryugenii TaxID=1917863 RepID=A0A2P2E028_9LEPT|nr:PP2C family protein-serine/threonine phosphatase [Leptospira ryugenii]GBF50244.1 serine phosphatase RsbU [Leptospira ryugenii]
MVKLFSTTKPFQDSLQIEEEVLTISRICLSVFVAFIGFGIFAPVKELGLYDPIWLRVLHTGITFCFILLTYFSEYVRKRIQPIMLVFFYTMSSHSLILLYWNSLYIGYLVGMILVITCIGVSFVERRWLVHYLTFVVSAGVLVGIYTEKPQVELSLYLSSIITPALVSYLTLNTRLSAVEKLRISQIQLKKFHDRISNDLEMASETQNHLVTKVWPNSKGIHCSSFFKSYEKIGGDAISFVIRDDEEIAIFFADVAGHGIASAMVSAMAVLSFKMNASLEATPAACLNAMHQELQAIVKTNHISACVFFYSIAEKKLSYSYAGHPPILLISQSNNCQILEGNGTVIVSPLEPKLKNYTKHLQSGDRILLYSDGITDVYNSSEQEFGIEGLISSIQKNSNKKGEELLHSIYHLAKEYSNQVSIDDMSMFLLEIE